MGGIFLLEDCCTAPAGMDFGPAVSTNKNASAQICRGVNFVTVHSVTSNALRDAQKSCIRMISRRNSRVFCELCSQKTPRGMLPVNSNAGLTIH